eukprot:m.18219 g.18219  ORF g.18219 m.18219 type:complete len:128 (-) comp3653_c0_seq1:189-572(-)
MARRFSFRKKVPRRGPVQPQLQSSMQSLDGSLASHVNVPGDPVNAEPGKAPFSLNLGNYELIFDNGQWHSESVPENQSSRQAAALQRDNDELREENNMLRYKVDVLLDLLAGARADFQVLQQSIGSA